MPDNDEPIALEYCTLPGTIKLTPPALGYAKRFQAVVPGSIVAFIWYVGQRMQTNKDAPWIDMGPGVGLQAYSIEEIPEAAIYREDSFCYAVLIEKEVVANHPQRTIDLDERGNPVLR